MPFMETEYLLLHSKELTTESYPDPGLFNQHPLTASLRFTSLFSTTYTVVSRVVY